MVVITAGMDWGQPYSCSGWAESFGLTIPILDDNSGNNIYGLFGIGYVPHNVVIGGDGTLIFTDSGFNEGIIAVSYTLYYRSLRLTWSSPSCE